MLLTIIYSPLSSQQPKCQKSSAKQLEKVEVKDMLILYKCFVGPKLQEDGRRFSQNRTTCELDPKLHKIIFFYKPQIFVRPDIFYIQLMQEQQHMRLNHSLPGCTGHFHVVLQLCHRNSKKSSISYGRPIVPIHQQYSQKMTLMYLGIISKRDP